MNRLTAMFRTRRLHALVLWLALLLPLAQLAAMRHAHSHDQAPGHADACALCLTATAVTAGGAVSAPTAVPVVTPASVFMRLALSAWLPAAVFTAYLSRAPPFASH